MKIFALSLPKGQEVEKVKIFAWLKWILSKHILFFTITYITCL